MASRGFFQPSRELGRYVEFGFVLPDYVRRGNEDIRRLPTARATIYFAANVRIGSSTNQIPAGLFCEGPHANGFSVSSDAGEMVALKVRSGGLRALLGVPAREIRNATLSLDELWGRSAAFLAEQMAEVKSAKERVHLLQRELIRRSRAFDRHDEVALGVATAIEKSSGKLRIASLSAETGLGQRSLLQRFDDWVGLTPKQYARLARLRSTISHLAEHPEVDWTELALSHGYYDQPHLIHEFQDLVGYSPSTFTRHRSAFSPIGAPAYGRSALPRREQLLYRSLGLVSRWVPASRTRATASNRPDAE